MTLYKLVYVETKAKYLFLSGELKTAEQMALNALEQAKTWKKASLIIHLNELLHEINMVEENYKDALKYYEAKTKINLWTHYLGKHKYAQAWMSEAIAKQGGHIATPRPSTNSQSTPPKPRRSSDVSTLSKAPSVSSLIDEETRIKRESESESNQG